VSEIRVGMKIVEFVVISAVENLSWHSQPDFTYRIVMACLSSVDTYFTSLPICMPHRIFDVEIFLFFFKDCILNLTSCLLTFCKYEK